MADLPEVEGGAAVDSTRVHSLPRRVCLQLASRAPHPAPHHLQLVLASRSPPFPLEQQEVYHLLRVMAAGVIEKNEDLSRVKVSQ